jgi:hypothetical protein
VAEVYVSAFAEAVLRDDVRYLPLFRDHRVAGNWLPKTMYITRYGDSSFRPVATFEEDIDLTSATMKGVHIRGDSLATWREGGMMLRTQSAPGEGPSMQNYAAWVGWNNRIQGEKDTTKLATPAALTITLDDTARRTLALDARSALEFVLLPTDALPGPRKPAGKDEKKEGADSTRRAAPRPKPKQDDEKPPIDLSVVVTDANGVSASVPLSRYGAIRRPLEMSILRRKDREKANYPRLYEMVLQSYRIPFADLQSAVPHLDVTRIESVRFLFDRAPAGTVIIDDVGFSRS